MNRRWAMLQRLVVVLASGAVLPIGCNYYTYGNIQALTTAGGEAVIQAASDSLLGGIGADFDAIVRAPLTDFSQSVWGNYIDDRLPDDLPNNPIVRR